MIFLCAWVLVTACAGMTGTVVGAFTPTPAPGFAVATIILVVGTGLCLVGAIRASRRAGRYATCPACAFDVRQVQPGPDGSMRCPACGQYLLKGG